MSKSEICFGLIFLLPYIYLLTYGTTREKVIKALICMCNLLLDQVCNQVTNLKRGCATRVLVYCFYCTQRMSNWQKGFSKSSTTLWRVLQLLLFLLLVSELILQKFKME